MHKFGKFFTGALLCGAVLLSGFNGLAQVAVTAAPEPPKAWHLMDLKTDGYFGISAKQAYLFVAGKKSKQVVVATIDSGIDTAQKDLKPVLWTNLKEIPGNGIDDDKNGYVDDIHGWDFLGGPGGKCDFTETTEEVREYNKLKGKYGTVVSAPAGSEKEFAYWEKVKLTYETTVKKSKEEIAAITKPETEVRYTAKGILVVN